jgi:hypothetical protein
VDNNVEPVFTSHVLGVEGSSRVISNVMNQHDERGGYSLPPPEMLALTEQESMSREMGMLREELAMGVESDLISHVERLRPVQGTHPDHVQFAVKVRLGGTGKLRLAVSVA